MNGKIFNKYIEIHIAVTSNIGNNFKVGHIFESLMQKYLKKLPHAYDENKKWNGC